MAVLVLARRICDRPGHAFFNKIIRYHTIEHRQSGDAGPPHALSTATISWH